MGGVRLGTDGEGNVGYFGDDDVLVPFKKFNKQFIGSYNSANKTIDMSFYNNYKNLTIDNFIFDIKSVTCAVYNGDYPQKTTTLNKSYDNMTGLLTFNLYDNVSNRYSVLANIDIYLIA